jgi:hypothetical protein
MNEFALGGKKRGSLGGQKEGKMQMPQDGRPFKSNPPFDNSVSLEQHAHIFIYFAFSNRWFAIF